MPEDKKAENKEASKKQLSQTRLSGHRRNGCCRRCVDRDNARKGGGVATRRLQEPPILHPKAIWFMTARNARAARPAC